MADIALMPEPVAIAAVADVPDDTDLEPLAERVVRAREALGDIHARLAALAERAAQRQQELAALDERVAEAQTRAARAGEGLSAFPPAISRAKARLLLASSQPARTAVKKEIDIVQARQREATREQAQAQTEATRLAAEAHVERERLTAEAAQEGAERAELESLAPALQEELAELHVAAGEAILRRLEAERGDLEAARAAAQAQIDRAAVALEQHAAHVREQLAPHPTLLAQAEGGPLLPRRAARVERALESHLHTLAVLAEGAVETELAGGVPLMFVLSFPGGPGLGWALQGRAPAVWADAIKRAETWLGHFRDRYRTAR